ncbi:hypothetical protein [Clostridium sp. C8]|jgi:hypothetical protein|uniref:hypothetical protein n=1 Tax=Clostridium sp. C8 TaxID=1667357 RepID=UPI00069B60CF|nr:hypothetical protein [Clostridium sp. C8]
MGIFDILKKIKRKSNEDEYDEYYEYEFEEKLESLKKVDNRVNDESNEEVYEKKEVEAYEDKEDINIKEEVKLTKEEIEELLLNEILKVIEVYDDFDKVKIAAREAANNIGKEYLNELPNYLNGRIHRPSRFIDKYDDIGEWTIIVENSVLMIIYSFKEDAVAVLQRISQRNSNLNLKATNLLCKLASENTKTDEIVNSIMNNLIAFNDENKIIILGFMSQIKENNQVIGLIQHFYKSFIKSGEIENAYKTLKHLINAAERFTNGHLNFLKSLAMGKNTLNLEEITAIEENDPKSVRMDKVDDYLRVDAAITYYTLNQKDDDINSKLYYLSEYSLDKNLRNKIKSLLKL